MHLVVVFMVIMKNTFNENDDIKDPNSPYAASKNKGEIMAKLYNKLYKLPVIGLTFLQFMALR